MPAVGSVAATTLKSGTVTLTYNAQTSAHIEEAHADRANDTWEHLQRKLAEFLTNVVREACASADCEVIVADALKEFQGAATAEGSLFYDAPALALHKEMWDIVTRDKFGIPKQHNFSEWCQWIATHSAATEHAAASSSATEHVAANSAATEHADVGPFRKLAESILIYETTPEQKKDPRYRLRTGRSITTQQRSFLNNILRKNLGDARVAYYIFQRGIPPLLDPPVREEYCGFLKPTRALLQNMLEEFMTWHASLLIYLLEGQRQPGMDTQRKLSDLGQKEWRAERRSKKEETRRQLRQGARLAKLRDSGKRKFDNMSATEQQVLEDYDCNRLKRRYEQHRIQKPQHFDTKKQ